MVGVIPPGLIGCLVLLLVQTHGDHGVVPRVEKPQKFVVELRAYGRILQGFERRFRAEELFAVEDHRVIRVRPEEPVLQCFHLRMHDSLHVLKFHDDSREREKPMIGVIRALQIGIAYLVDVDSVLQAANLTSSGGAVRPSCTRKEDKASGRISGASRSLLGRSGTRELDPRVHPVILRAVRMGRIGFLR